MLLDRHRERVEHGEWLTGTVAAAVANYGMRHPEKWVYPHDLVSTLPKPKEKRKRMDRKAVAMSAADFIAALRGQKKKT